MNYLHIDFELFDTKSLLSRWQHLANFIISEYDQYQDFTVLCLMPMEFYPKLFDSLEKITKKIKQENPDWKIFLIANNWYTDTISTWQSQLCVDDVLIINVLLMRTVNANVNLKNNRSRQQVLPDKKCLFLTGRTDELHRIGLLYSLNKKISLEDNCIWSLIVNHNDYQLLLPIVQKICPNTGINDLVKFCQQYYCTPDFEINSENVSINDLYKNANMWAAPDLYQSTSFSIISETYFEVNEIDIITEKTFKAMYYQHPFIMAAPVGTLHQLKMMGFETYEKFLPNPDYDVVEDPLVRLNQIVDNAAYWINNIDRFASEIESYTLHNKKVLLDMYQIEIDKFTKFNHKHQLEINFEDVMHLTTSKEFYNNVAKILPLRHEVGPAIVGTADSDNNSFRIFYNNVKDPSWPECLNETDFYLLPAHIKDECINVFGYHPNCPQ